MLGNRLARTSLAACGAAVAGALAFAAPAAADVTMSPTQGTQNDAAELVFTVTSEPGAAPTTKVQVAMPDATPIAEVYPLSNPDWAPALAQRTLDKSIQAIHGSVTNQVVTAITWTTRPGWQLPPGSSSELHVSLGPLPAAAQVAFTVTQTHADGSVTHPPNLVLNLAPAPAGQDPAQAHNHGGAPGAGTGEPGTGAGAPDADDVAADDDTGSGGGTKVALLVSVLVVGVLGGAAVGSLLLPRLRRGASSLKVSREVLDDAPAAPAPEPEHTVSS